MSDFTITEQELTTVFGDGLDQQFVNDTVIVLNEYRLYFGVSKRIDIVRFFAQCYHETSFYQTHTGMKPRLEENLNFSDETLFRLSRYWRTHREELAEVRKMGVLEQRKAIINRWYKDGYDWIGHGCLMVTGKENTIKCLEMIELAIKEPLLTCDESPKDGVFERYDIFWLLGLAYWRLMGGYTCNKTMDCTNKINRGLPMREKKARVRTANRLNHKLFTIQ